MKPLSLKLLGPVEILLGGKALAAAALGRPACLLAYLAVENRPHPRDALAQLFWPEQSPDSARHNLRQSLYRLRRALGDLNSASPLLLVERNTVQLNPQHTRTDVQALYSDDPSRALDSGPGEKRAAVQHLMQQVALYRGEFLSGIPLPHSDGFDNWLRQRQDSLRQRALELLDRLLDILERSGNLESALPYAERRLELDSLDERGHRRLMRLHAATGRRAAALDCYERCRHLLAEELGISPEAETRELHRQILRGETAVTLPLDQTPVSTFSQTGPERRQVTLLCCELSTSECTDPEELATLLAHARKRGTELLRQAGGHVVRTHGNVLLAYFGYPVADEHAAHLAVGGGRRLLRDLHTPGVTIRVGIHTALVITSADPESPDATGQMARTAFHLSQWASGQDLIVSGDTLHLLGEACVGERLGETGTPTGASPLPAYRLQEGIIVRTPAEASGPMVGREAELEQLITAWRTATRNGHRGAVMVVGEPGIGKSRLLRAFRDWLAQQPCHVREARCLPEYRHSPLHPFVEMLRRVMDFHAHDDHAARQRKLRDYCRCHHPHFGEAELDLLAMLLSLQEEAQEAPSEHLKQRIRALFVDMVTRLSAERPLVLLIEDLHWSDPSTREILLQYLEQAAQARVLLVMSARSQPELSAIENRCERITLKPLAPAHITHIVRHLSGEHRLPPALLQRILSSADGVPLYAEEMTRMLLGADTLPGGPGALPVPATLQDLLMSRLDSLGTAKQLLQSAAVIGREFTRDLLGEIAGCDAVELQACLDQALASGLLVPLAEGDAPAYQFRHALIQETAYASLLRRERQALHGRVAEALLRRTLDADPERIAQHLTAAEDFSRAIEYWLLAGHRDLQRSADAEALEHLQQGLGLLPRVADEQTRRALEFELVSSMGVLMVGTQGYGARETAAVYVRARELAQALGESERLFRSLWGLWLISSTRSHFEESGRLATELLSIAQEQNDATLLLQAHYAMANTLFFQGDFAAAGDHAREAIGQYRADEHDPLIYVYGDSSYVGSLCFKAWLDWFHRLAPADALTTMEQAIATAQRLHHPNSLGFALAFRALLYLYCEETLPAQAAAEELLQVTAESSLPLWHAVALSVQGWALAARGQIEGLHQARRGAELARQSMAGVESVFLPILACTQAALQDYAAALQTADAALQHSEIKAARHYLAGLYWRRGEWLLQASAHGQEAAEASFRQALAISRAQGARLLEVQAAAGLARLWLAQGRRHDAAALLHEIALPPAAAQVPALRAAAQLWRMLAGPDG